jgi:hypothetical protein
MNKSKVRNKKGRAARDPRAPQPGSVAQKTNTHGKMTITADGGFWRSILSSLETRPIEPAPICGASGVRHEVLGVGVDDSRQRLIIITDSMDPKSAAFAQSDIQSLYVDMKVIVARAVLANAYGGLVGLRGMLPKDLILDINHIGHLIGESVEKEDGWVDAQTKRLADALMKSVTGDPLLRPHSALAALVQVVAQLSRLNWRNVNFNDSSKLLALGPLFNGPIQDIDAELGICPIPVHKMSADEVDNIKSSSGLEPARELLKRIGVFGYFFPEKEELVLGLVDRGVSKEDALTEAIDIARKNGHVLSGNKNSLLEVVDSLKSRGMIVSGELGFETTISGQSARAIVKYQPKESLYVKMLNLLGVAASLLKSIIGK